MLALALIGAVLYRVRGGGLGLSLGTQGARLAWVLPTGALLGLLAGAPYSVFPALWATLFLGLLIPHGWAQDPFADLRATLWGMPAVHAARAGLALAPLAGLHTLPTGAALTMLGFCAGTGLAYASQRLFTLRIPLLAPGGETGELFTGALWWAGIIVGFRYA